MTPAKHHSSASSSWEGKKRGPIGPINVLISKKSQFSPSACKLLASNDLWQVIRGRKNEKDGFPCPPLLKKRRLKHQVSGGVFYLAQSIRSSVFVAVVSSEGTVGCCHGREPVEAGANAIAKVVHGLTPMATPCRHFVAITNARHFVAVVQSCGCISRKLAENL